MRVGPQVQALPREAELTAARPAYRLRRAREEDRPAIEALQRRAVQAIDGDLYTSEEVATVLMRMAHLDPRLITASAYTVAETPTAQGLRLAGCGGWAPARFEDGCAEIRAVFTDPGHAGRGVGRLIVAEALAAARTAGFRDIRVRSSLNAVAFYERLGFHPLREMTLDVGARLPLRTLYMAWRPDG